LFDDASPALQQRVEQVVRLIRSKGVGVYFCSQNPDDVPQVILGQMGNRVQHALRAFTPRDQKAVRSAAETFAPNPKIDVAAAITQLGVGEALVSTLQEGGVPMPVERALIVAPSCRIGAITDAERSMIRSRSPVGTKYDTAIDRESAFEILSQRAQSTLQTSPSATAPGVAQPRASMPSPPSQQGSTQSPQQNSGPRWTDGIRDALLGTSRRQGMLEAFAKSAARNAGGQIMRGVLGSLLGKR